MARFRKKPVEIEAHAWLPGDVESAGYVIGWISSQGGRCEIVDGLGDSCVLGIHTLEGVMKASPGDWIIREPFPTGDRKFYPCKPDIFVATYEPVDD